MGDEGPICYGVGKRAFCVIETQVVIAKTCGVREPSLPHRHKQVIDRGFRRVLLDFFFATLMHGPAEVAQQRGVRGVDVASVQSCG